ncbi:ATP-binding protein [Denitratisoma sp. agr-D3]
MRLNSLGVKVLFAYVVSAALSILLIVLAASAIMNSQGNIVSRADVDDTAKDMAGDLQFDSEGVPVGFSPDVVDFEWIFENMKQETAYRVLDASGNAVLSSGAGEAFWPKNAAVSRLERGSFEFEREGIVMLGATEPVEHKGRVWFLQFVVSARFMELSFDAFVLPATRTGIIVFSLVLLFVFGVCGYVTLRYAFKPLREISKSAAAISSRSIHARLKTEAVPSEIAPLVDSFNHVLERLERGYRVQQEFLGNAAHELKTPLALIRAQIELRDGGGKADRDSLLGDVEYMTRQVQQLLLLAEASEVHNYSLTLVRMLDVAHEVAAYLQRMAEAAHVHLTISATGEVKWKADRGALFTLLKNLLENAIQHAPAETEVSVEIRHDAVLVRDMGPGVDATQLPRLFDRFWRASHRRDHGAGLGLAICQEIALAHGWRLTAERADPGLRFRLERGDSGDTEPTAVPHMGRI